MNVNVTNAKYSVKTKYCQHYYNLLYYMLLLVLILKHMYIYFISFYVNEKKKTGVLSIHIFSTIKIFSPTYIHINESLFPFVTPSRVNVWTNFANSFSN